MPKRPKYRTFGQNSNLGRDPHKKNSYERRDYESVDEKNLSLAIAQKKESGPKWVNAKCIHFFISIIISQVRRRFPVDYRYKFIRAKIWNIIYHL